MGGVWGVGASLTMETVSPSARGIVSGLLQAGYPAGYLIAALVYAILFPLVGWRGLFVLGAVPALLSNHIAHTELDEFKSGNEWPSQRRNRPPGERRQAKNMHGKAGTPIGEQRVTAVARGLDPGLERVLVRAAS